jgi:hypothetical protein
MKAALEATRMQSSETEDRWYVDVGGTPKMMTLDELVEAFEGGIITANTLVTEVGGSEWKPLKEVADLGDEEEAPPPSVQAPALASPSMLPAPPVQRVSAAPVSANRESAWPPAAAWSQAPLPSRPSAAPLSLGPNSTIPVVQDLGADLDDMPFKKSRSKLPLILAAAVVVLGGIGFAAMKSGVAAPAPVPVPAAQPVEFQKTVVTPIPTSAPAAAPTTEAAKPEGEKAEATDSKGLTDDVKAKLLAADKDRDAKKKSARAGGKARGGGARAKGNSGGSGVFRAGGDASDPLNSKL